MQIKDFPSKRHYFLFQVFGSSLSLFNTHKGIPKVKVIFFLYFPLIKPTISSILTSTYTLRKFQKPANENGLLVSQHNAKFPRRGTFFLRNLQGNMSGGGHIQLGGGRVIITGTADNFTLQGRCLTQERVTYCFLKTLTFSVSRQSFPKITFNLAYRPAIVKDSLRLSSDH